MSLIYMFLSLFGYGWLIPSIALIWILEKLGIFKPRNGYQEQFVLLGFLSVGAIINIALFFILPAAWIGWYVLILSIWTVTNIVVFISI